MSRFHGLTIVCVLVGLVMVNALATRSQWEAWKVKHGKQYDSPTEEAAHYATFVHNVRLINHLNAVSPTARFAVNAFADVSAEAFARLWFSPPQEPLASGAHVLQWHVKADVPSSWDWRKNGLVDGQSCITPIGNQGQCGSTWAFGVVENVESMCCIGGFIPPQTDLSVQQLVDCDKNSFGCNGGDIGNGYAYVKQYGLEKESDYPYHAGSGQCEYDAKQVVARIASFGLVQNATSEPLLKAYVGTQGPATACVDASTWQFYEGGVLTTCASGSIDHCVQVVGYDTMEGKPAWIVRNQWGTDWGVNGYIYIEMGKNLCGIANDTMSCVPERA